MVKQDTKPKSSTKNRKFSRVSKMGKLRSRSQNFQRKCSATKGQLKTVEISLKAKQTENFIKNLSDRPLSDIEKIALGRGLKFIATPPKPTRLSILKALKGLKRTMRIRYNLYGKNVQKLSKFRLKSDWFPSVTYSQNLEDYFEATKVYLAKVRHALTIPQRQKKLPYNH